MSGSIFHTPHSSDLNNSCHLHREPPNIMRQRHDNLGQQINVNSVHFNFMSQTIFRSIYSDLLLMRTLHPRKKNKKSLILRNILTQKNHLKTSMNTETFLSEDRLMILVTALSRKFDFPIWIRL